MPRRDSFLLRTDPAVLDALRRWAADELRSANAQLDFVLRQALRKAGRLPDVGQAGGTSSNRTPKNSE